MVTTQASLECEYCGCSGVTLYGWHADIWCRSCIEAQAGVLEMTGSLEDAPVGRPDNPTYAQPFVLDAPEQSGV